LPVGGGEDFNFTAAQVQRALKQLQFLSTRWIFLVLFLHDSFLFSAQGFLNATLRLVLN
jgi:hypothetical protein